MKNPALPLPVKISMANILKTLFQLSPVGGVMLFNHLRYSKILQVGLHVATSLMAVCDVLHGTLGVSLDRFFLRKETESSSSTISGSSLKTTTSSVSRRYTGRMSFSRLFRCGPRDSSYLGRSFLETRMQEDRPHASTRTFCLRMPL